MPILPILRPAPSLSLSNEAGETSEGLTYVAKISKRVPVLHMSFKDIDPEAQKCLNDMGIYIFDPAVLGSLSYSSEIAKLLSKVKAKSVLEAFKRVSDAASSPDVVTPWTPQQVRTAFFFISYISHYPHPVPGPTNMLLASTCPHTTIVHHLY